MTFIQLIILLFKAILLCHAGLVLVTFGRLLLRRTKARRNQDDDRDHLLSEYVPSSSEARIKRLSELEEEAFILEDIRQRASREVEKLKNKDDDLD